MPADEVLAELERAGIAARGPARAVSGGSISRTLRVPTNHGPVLLKLEPRERLDMLEAEREALAALRETKAVAVPAVLACGAAGEDGYLALEWVDFAGKTAAAERQLGEALAALHRHTAPAFGWHRDNYIGRTPQPNPRSEDWMGFFRDARLRHQLALAVRNGLGADAERLGQALLDGLGRFFAGHSPAPSLLHGDLWGGNWSATADGRPYLFDPASYYGDREADLAMTRLFGGFGAEFHRAYQEAWPLPQGSQRRVELYNLYHLLNHFNLFGGTYRGEVLSVLRRLVRS